MYIFILQLIHLFYMSMLCVLMWSDFFVAHLTAK